MVARWRILLGLIFITLLSSCAMKFNNSIEELADNAEDYLESDSSDDAEDSDSDDSSSSSTYVYLYSLSFGDAKLTAVKADVSTGEMEVIEQESVGASPRGLVASRDGKCLWATGYAAGQIDGFSVDLSDGSLTHVETIAITLPWGIKVHPTLDVLYSTSQFDIQPYTINSDCSLTALTAVTLGGASGPREIAFLDNYLFTIADTVSSFDYLYVYSMNPTTGALTLSKSGVSNNEQSIGILAREGTSAGQYQTFIQAWGGQTYQSNFSTTGPTITPLVNTHTTALWCNQNQFGPDDRMYVTTTDEIHAFTLNADGTAASTSVIDLPGGANAFGGGRLIFYTDSLVFVTASMQDKLYSFDLTADVLTPIDSVDVGDNPITDAVLIDPN